MENVREKISARILQNGVATTLLLIAMAPRGVDRDINV